MSIKYVHVKHSNGAEDMVPESTVAAREAAGQLKIIDPTPGRYRKISAPALAAAGSPKRSPKPKTADPVVTDPAADAASTAEEATK